MENQIPKQSFAEAVKNKMLSVRPCEICNREVAIRDTRQRPVLCYQHTSKKGMMGHYQNFEHGRLTEQEKNRIMTDRTTRRGPFGPKKA